MPKCKNCKESFKVKHFNQKFCLLKDECIKAFAYYVKEQRQKQQAKQWSKEKKVIKEKLMTKSDKLNLAQKVFNTFIRLRDNGKPCISCDKPLIGKFDAGHFFSVGAYPNLRFNEKNVFGQCVHCNRDKHGNIKEYDLRLQNILSEQEYNQLLEDRNKPLKLSFNEVDELIKKYRLKIKEFSK